MYEICWTPGCENAATGYPICAPAVDPDFLAKRRCNTCGNAIDGLVFLIRDGGASYQEMVEFIEPLLAMTKGEIGIVALSAVVFLDAAMAEVSGTTEPAA